jgi:hypothetical protein
MRALPLVLLVLLAGCSSGPGLLEKRAPEPVTRDALIAPPWQALVKAGPEANNDVDYETLNGTPAPPPVLAQGAPLPTPLPVTPPSPKAAAAGATEIKSVAVVGVEGATGQGNRELAAAMISVLKKAGWPVSAKPGPATLSISAQVALDAAAGPNQMVHLTWRVVSPKGKELGTVAQNNAIAAHTLDTTWGPAANAAAEAAAEGLFKLIGQYR